MESHTWYPHAETKKHGRESSLHDSSGTYSHDDEGSAAVYPRKLVLRKSADSEAAGKAAVRSAKMQSSNAGKQETEQKADYLRRIHFAGSHCCLSAFSRKAAAEDHACTYSST